MLLPNFFSRPKINKDNELKLICILLSQTSVQALMIKVDEDSEILSQSQPLTYQDHQQGLVRVDEALQNLDGDSESINQVVFAIDEDWFKDGAILPEYVSFLENITKDLSLQPLGFIINTEALTYSLTQKKPHFSGFVGIIGSQSLILTGLTNGKLEGVEYIGRSLDSVADCAEGLARFQMMKDGGALPGSIVITSFELSLQELKEFQQDIIGAEWPEQVTFLQTPVVEMILTEDYLQYIVMAVGRAVRGDQNTDQFSQNLEASPASLLVDNQEELTTAQKSQDWMVDEVDEKSAEKAFKEIQHFESIDDDVEVTAPNKSEASSFGIPITPDLLAEKPEKIEQKISSKIIPNKTDLEDEQLDSAALKKRKLKLAVIGSIFAGIVVVLIMGWVWLLTTSQVLVELEVESKVISQDTEIIVDSSISSSDPENLRLSAQSTSVVLNDRATVPTSGVKIVGEEAKGTVALFNKTESIKTFDAGTILKSGELEFVLDEAVTVASASVKPRPGGEEKEFGKATGKATARVIGAEGNLEENTALVILPYDTSTYEAQIEESFKGGSSREVRVVAQKDLDDAVEAIREDILEQAEVALAKDLADGYFLVKNQSIVAQKAEFGSEVGTEAENVTVALELEISDLVYSRDDLVPLAQAVLAESVPDGYKLIEEKIQILTADGLAATTNSQVASGITLSVNISTQVQAVVDLDQLKEELKRMKTSEISALAKSFEGIKSINLSFSPPIASAVVKRMPANESRIFIVVINNHEK